MEINQRIKRLLESLVGEQLESFRLSLDQGLKDWENRLGIDPEGSNTGNQRGPKPTGASPNFGYKKPDSSRNKSPYTDQLLKDLAAFGLTPPVSLDELKQARKRELKKYHPDRFAQEPSKIDSAKRISQILGETYERLLKQLS